jgi:hypothetical protein
VRTAARDVKSIDRAPMRERSRGGAAYVLALVWVVAAAALYAVEALRLAGGLG